MSPLGHDEAAGGSGTRTRFGDCNRLAPLATREIEAPATSGAGGPGRRSKYGRDRPGRASDTIVKSDASILAHGAFPEA